MINIYCEYNINRSQRKIRDLGEGMELLESNESELRESNSIHTQSCEQLRT